MASLPVEFSVNVVGEVTGEQFGGVFKCKQRLSHRDRLAEDQIRRDLLGGKQSEASPSAYNLAATLAYIRVRLVDAPKWWSGSNNGLDLDDEEVLGAVLKGVEKVENDALAAVKKAGTDAAEAMKK